MSTSHIRPGETVYLNGRKITNIGVDDIFIDEVANPIAAPSPESLLTWGSEEIVPERESGYYWVKRRYVEEPNPEWQIAEYGAGYWQFIGEVMEWGDDIIATVGPHILPPPK